MSDWEKPEERRYDIALEAQAELERRNKRAYWMAGTLSGIGVLLALSVAKLHLSTLAGKIAGLAGPLCFLAAWAISRWAKDRENGPEYVSILDPGDARDYRIDGG